MHRILWVLAPKSNKTSLSLWRTHSRKTRRNSSPSIRRKTKKARTILPSSRLIPAIMRAPFNRKSIWATTKHSFRLCRVHLSPRTPNNRCRLNICIRSRSCRANTWRQSNSSSPLWTLNQTKTTKRSSPSQTTLLRWDKHLSLAYKTKISSKNFGRPEIRANRPLNQKIICLLTLSVNNSILLNLIKSRNPNFFISLRLLAKILRVKIRSTNIKQR